LKKSAVLFLARHEVLCVHLRRVLTIVLLDKSSDEPLNT